jgi:Protein of unknown function (DUF1071)
MLTQDPNQPGLLVDRKDLIAKLLAKNVNDHVEKKNGLSYLSWAWAWAEALKADANATYRVEMFDGKCFMDINGTAMVFVTVTMFGKPMTCQLPVMDYRNKAIPKPDAFAVNTAIMRCMTKALALHGLGMYLYSGEDLPEEGKTVVITPTQGATDNIPQEELQYLQEMAVELIAMCEQGDPKAAWVKLESENLDSEQKVALWTLLPSKVRSALKKAKEI